MKSGEGMKAEGLLARLQEYSESDFYPFHMPGHKRMLRPFGDLYGIDITEIADFDNLHHAEGVLLECEQRAARLYGAEETFFLVNGSTCGILAAVSASVRRGGTLLMARNCHKAAYHAVLLNDLHAVYLYPPIDMVRGVYGSIQPREVRAMLALHPDTAAVLITSPTYDGVVSDVRQIARIVHEAGAILIVDEAHGAHFGMHPYFPEHSISLGADLVINSVHKTLPAPTQTALLHVQGDRVDRARLRSYLGIYQTSSPSYVLMAGIDECVRLLEERGRSLFCGFVRRLDRLRQALGTMRVLHLIDGREPQLQCFGYDRSKVLISTERCGLGGAALSEWLRREFHLEMEMEAEHYVTAITTIADTQEGLDRLQAALLEIDARLCGRADSDRNALSSELCDGKGGGEEIFPLWLADGVRLSPGVGQWPFNEEVMTISCAQDAPKEKIPLSLSAGRISGEFLYLYPPGIPLLVPGERISADLLEQLERYRSLGLQLEGLADYRAEEILAVCGIVTGQADIDFM